MGGLGRVGEVGKVFLDEFTLLGGGGKGEFSHQRQVALVTGEVKG